MRFVKIDLTDDQLLTLAKIALAPGGVVPDEPGDVRAAGLHFPQTVWLGTHGYLEPVERLVEGRPAPHLRVTAKGRRELMIRFVD